MNQSNCNKDCKSCKCRCNNLLKSNVIGIIYDKNLKLDEIIRLIRYFFNYYKIDSHLFRLYYYAIDYEYCQQYGLNPDIDMYFRTLGKSQLNYWSEGTDRCDNYESLVKEVSANLGVLLFLRSKNSNDDVVYNMEALAKSMNKVICIDLNIN